MEPHPHEDWPGFELGVRCQRRRRCGWRRRERDEEGVALRVDLDSSVRDERLTKDTAVLGERVRVAVRSERMQ